MPTLGYVEIYPQSTNRAVVGDWSYYSNAITYLVSSALQDANVACKDITKVVVQLGALDEPWDENPVCRVALINQKLDTTELEKLAPENIQRALLKAFIIGLKKLSTPNAIPHELLNSIENELNRQGFQQIVPITDAVDKKYLRLNPRGAIRLRMKTGTTSFKYIAEISRVAGTREELSNITLMDIRPSWFLAARNFIGFRLTDSKKTLQLKLAHPRDRTLDTEMSYLNDLLFDRRYYDTSESELTYVVNIGADEVEFLFDISSLVS
jgi:hypothetical protein